MIKGKLIETIKIALGKDLNTIYGDDRIYEMHISLAYQELFFKSYEAIKDNLDFYAKSYDITINTEGDPDVGTDIYYSTLPVNPVDLPLTNKGVIGVDYIGDLKYEFYPATMNDVKHFNNTQGSLVLNKVLYTLHGKNIYYTKNISPDIVGQNVTVKIIPAFEDIDFYDEVYIPGGNYMTLVQLLAPYLSNMPYYNLLNNNSNIK